MASWLPPNRDDGWRAGGAKAARLVLLAHKRRENWRRAYDLWLLASVCEGFGGYVGMGLANDVSNAVWEACNTQCEWEEALQEFS